MISFNDLTIANSKRAFERNDAGVHCWTPTQWALGMFGECGEACNIIKKLNRIETKDPATNASEFDDLISALADELADIVIYADLLAQRCDIDLGSMIQTKFNETSIKVGCETFLGREIDQDGELK